MAKKPKPTVTDEIWDEVLPEVQEKDGKPDKPKAAKKKPFTVLLTPEMIERIKNCVYETRGLTVSELVETSCGKEIDSREKIRGGTFPPRQGEIKAGRPVK